jgi:hypothetical protein
MDEVEAPTGKWWAQHAYWPETDPPAPMPDSHKHYAESGSTLEASFKALDYVPVSAPGSEPEPDAEPVAKHVGEHGPELTGLPSVVSRRRS